MGPQVYFATHTAFQVNLLFVWPALYTIDTFGGRSLLPFTFPDMAWSLLEGPVP